IAIATAAWSTISTSSMAPRCSPRPCASTPGARRRLDCRRGMLVEAAVPFSVFERSLAGDGPPGGLTPALTALWWASKGEWEKSHAIVMDEDGQDCAWVHAHLHRVESDLANARYWYARAGKPVAMGALAAEWHAIVTALLSDVRA